MFEQIGDPELKSISVKRRHFLVNSIEKISIKAEEL